MKDIIKALPLKAEFIFVTGIAFGYFILCSISAVFSPYPAQITGNRLWFLVIYEPIILYIIYWFLKQREWPFENLKINPSLKATLYGILLVVLSYITYNVVWLAAYLMFPKIVMSINQPTLAGTQLNLLNILAVSIINPFFEEVLVVGYVITTLKSFKGESFAINISVAIRLAYHLYQGPLAAFSIIPIGLIFAYWYVKKENLWSLIVAHAVMDFIGLSLQQ
jgi:membrane protease YdiL (CAAX protease family)